MRRLHYDPAPLAHVVDDFEGDTSERLTGCELPAVADPDSDDEPLVYLNAFSVRRRPPRTASTRPCSVFITVTRINRFYGSRRGSIGTPHV